MFECILLLSISFHQFLIKIYTYKVFYTKTDNTKESSILWWNKSKDKILANNYFLITINN